MLRATDDGAATASAANLHVLFPDGAHAYVGASVAPWASRWPMGIPRLRMPGGAPSRSTLKLAEAFVTFLHLRADGLSYLPKRPVDWMVCDIVEQPARIAELVARWIGEGHARHALFNLKLPMKKRYEEVQRCDAIIHEALAKARKQDTLAIRQLYHDREEVTGYVARLPG